MIFSLNCTNNSTKLQYSLTYHQLLAFVRLGYVCMMTQIFSNHMAVPCGIVVSIPACHAGDQGSIPGLGNLLIDSSLIFHFSHLCFCELGTRAGFVGREAKKFSDEKMGRSFI